MTPGSHSLRAPCLAALAAGLLVATVFMTAGFMTAGGSAAPVAARQRADAAASPAGTATASAVDTDHGSLNPGAASRSGVRGSIGQRVTVWSLRGFVNDLRKPRPPRQRSERPTTGADGIEAMMTASMLRLMLSIDLHRPYLSEADDAGPIAGHYRSLLRPPSASC